ncbi:hypothetical protein ACEQPO_30235 [Bacillus sp. SL00103]
MSSGLVLVYLLGMIGLLLGGSTPILVISVLLIGIGQGASISLALTFIGLRQPIWEQAVMGLNGAVYRLFISRRWSTHDRYPLMSHIHGRRPLSSLSSFYFFCVFIRMRAGRSVYISD